MVPWPSGKAKVCKTFIPQFKSGRYLQKRASALQMLFFRLPLPFAAQENQIADRKKDNQKESPLLNFVPVLYSMDFP